MTVYPDYALGAGCLGLHRIESRRLPTLVGHEAQVGPTDTAKSCFLSYCEASEVCLEPISSALPREETVAAVLEQ